MEEAIYVVNQYLTADIQLNRLFSPNPVSPFPFFATEPGEFGPTSFPYIRYFVIPGVDNANFRIRRDLVYYAIGEKDVAKSGRIIERLMYLLNISDEPGFPVKDTTGKFNIQSIVFAGAARPNQPSQEEGKFERGLSFIITYTVIKVTSNAAYKLDVLLT